MIAGSDRIAVDIEFGGRSDIARCGHGAAGDDQMADLRREVAQLLRFLDPNREAVRG